MWWRLLVLAAGAALILADATAANAGGSSAVSVLMERLSRPAPDVLARFESAGMRDVRPHVLSPVEQARVSAALAALPPLHRSVLEQRLRRLSFVDGIPGHGTGLTSTVRDTNQFDITLRASLLDESLSSFLTTKERRLFEPDGSGHSIVVEATGIDALTYILLHEASHVVDASLRISSQLDSPFVHNIWKSRTTLMPQLAASLAATTAFRGKERIPVRQAESVYDALSRTPFVSLYATAAAPEDVAELVTWHQVSQRYGGTLTISIVDGEGTPIKRYQPLEFTGVKGRMQLVDALLRQGAH